MIMMKALHHNNKIKDHMNNILDQIGITKEELKTVS